MKPIKNIDFSFHVEQKTIENIKYIIFKEKEYPIDFDLLKKNSQYFYRNRKQFNQVNRIILLNGTDESLIDFSEETIEAFIASCSNEPCKISFSNVIPLQYLSYKFEYPGLEKILDKFINEHSDDLVFPSIKFKANLHPKEGQYDIPNFFYDTKKEEDIIATNLIKYIDSDDMLLLPIPILDRIFCQFETQQNKNKNNNSKIIIEFLFKCLDKYGIDASILFSHTDFQDQSVNVTKKLIQNYSDNFDFNMINSTLLKSTKQLTSELSKVKEECSIMFSEMKEKFNEQQESLLKMKEKEEKRINLIEKMFNEKLDKITNEEKTRIIERERKFEEEISKIKNEEETRKQEYEKEITKVKEEVKMKEKEFEEKNAKIKEEYEKRIKERDSEILEMREEITKIKEKERKLEIEISTIKNEKEIRKQENEKEIMGIKKEKESSNNSENKMIKMIKEIYSNKNKGNEITLFIKTSSGKTITIMANQLGLVEDLKKKIQDKEGIPPDQQILQIEYIGKRL